MKITGYTGRWVFSPGDTVGLRVSTRYDRFSVRLARHTGPIEEPAHWRDRLEWAGGIALDGLPGTNAPIRPGSSAVAKLGAELAARVGGASVNVFPTGWPKDDASLLRLGRVDVKTRGGALIVEVDGRRLETGLAVPLRQWSLLSLRIGSELVLESGGSRWSAPAPIDAPAEFALAEGFAGKLEAPRLLDRRGAVLAEWDFADGSSATVPGAPPFALVNGPTLHRTGRDWRSLGDIAHAAAFHDDDLADAAWPVAAELHLPQDLRSGAYAIVLSETPEIDFADRASFDILPLFMAPRERRERVALVMPTFSYRAYANSCFFEAADPRVFRRKAVSWSKPLHDHAEALRLRSLYDLHADGSGVALASLDRPQLTLRADYISLLQGFPHQYSADLGILGFLEQAGIGYDLLTDELLHERGAAALAGYEVVLTGSHPEYSSPELLDAYEGYSAGKGSLIYLGGNGFYWSVGIDPDNPALMEVRRRDGVRTWTAAPGETTHQTDGRPGGLWRRLGRPPNRLVGIGFSAHGYSGDGAYELVPGLDLAALPARTAAVLRQIGEGLFGIAGLELDCHDPALGAPGETMVLAHAVDMPAGYVPAIEAFGGLDAFLPDPADALQAAVKGDIVFGRLPGGGRFFSVGSIRWASGLLAPGDPHFVRRLTEAVLRDFLDAGGSRHA